MEREEHKGDEDGNIRLGNREEDGGQTRRGLKEETPSFQVRGDESGRPNSCEISGAELDNSAHGSTPEGSFTGENVGSAEVTGTNAGVAPVTAEEVLRRRTDLKKHRETQTGNEKMNVLTQPHVVLSS